MPIAIRVLTLVLVLAAVHPSRLEADGATSQSLNGVPATVLPFPRSERAARVWDARGCWSVCQSSCTAGQAACLKSGAEPQADCVASTDACDRACQRDCRSGAGPFLPFDW
ncbi:MAG: hypothetical protein AB7O50_05280 [Pseudolabrys sp.]